MPKDKSEREIEHRERSRKYYHEHLEVEREKRRIYEKAHPEGARERNLRYHKKYPERVRERSKRYAVKCKLWRMQHPEIVKAENAANRLQIQTAKECSQCGATSNLDKHHSDYSKPLEVLTLCRSCHRLLHRPQIQTEVP